MTDSGSPRTNRRPSKVVPLPKKITSDCTDPRYADLVEEMRTWHGIILEAMVRAYPENPASVKETFEKQWDLLVKQRLVETLAAFVGPLVPAVDACTAYHHAAKKQDDDWNVCDGEVTLAVVERAGQPESPGGILSHVPGCLKHSRAAMSTLDAYHQKNGVYRLGQRWYQIVALDDARREIRLQELDDARRRRRKRWWFRG